MSRFPTWEEQVAELKAREAAEEAKKEKVRPTLEPAVAAVPPPLPASGISDGKRAGAPWSLVVGVAVCALAIGAAGAIVVLRRTAPPAGVDSSCAARQFGGYHDDDAPRDVSACGT